MHILIIKLAVTTILMLAGLVWIGIVSDCPARPEPTPSDFKHEFSKDK